jgi:hypothetical protein
VSSISRSRHPAYERAERQRFAVVIGPVLEKIVGTVGAAAIGEFGIDVARCHWDMTSISMFGAYPDQDEEYPQVKYGHPKDRRVDLFSEL